MRIAKLLKELQISFSTLLLFQEYLDVELKGISQVINEDTSLKIIALYKNKEIREQAFLKETDLEVIKKEGYVTKDCYKFIAYIKWYYNKSTKQEVGYLDQPKIGDIHFHGDSVMHTNPMTFKVNDIVIVELIKSEFKNRTKYNAKQVYRIAHETDLKTLVYLFLNNSNNELKRVTNKIINENLNLFKTKNTSLFFKSLSYYLRINNLNIVNIEFLLKIAYHLNTEVPEQITHHIKEKLSQKEKFQLFKNTYYKVPIKEIKEEVLTYVFFNAQESSTIIARLTKDESLDLYDNLFNKIINNTDELQNIGLLKLMINNGYKPDFTKLKSSYLFELWYDNNLDFFPIDVIYHKIIFFKNQFSKSRIALRDKTIKSVFTKLTEDQTSNLFAKANFEIDEINTKEQLQTFTFFIDHTKNPKLKEQFLSTLEKKANDYFKLHLFVLDYIDYINYDDVVIYTGLLSSELQKIFLKKILMLIETTVLNLSISDLNKITTYNYKENEFSKKIDGVGLDFTLSVILKIITDLSQQKITNRNDVFSIVANQIKNPKNLLEINGFFDKCDGRTVLKYKKNDNETELDYYTEKTNFEPRFSIFCDGRKSINKETNKFNLCLKSGLEFWWCENNKCFDICRKSKDTLNWKNYTLEDALRILKVNYSIKQYEILLNVINRVNLFFKHLSCKSCKTILHPKNKSHYGFYGSTRFQCKNAECDLKDMEIYLSHCQNARCYDIIDSRETTKCKPDGVDPSFGWYICKNCYACCSNNKLETRKNNLLQNGFNYKGHLEGHKDKGVICCTACGDKMRTIIYSKENYSNILNWFKDNKVTSPNIINSDINSRGNWWFIWSKNNFTTEKYRKQLKGIKNAGFNIPDFADKNKTTQLIAEPYNPITNSSNRFVCDNCTIEIDLSEKEYFDFGRLNAIKYHHDVIFKEYENS